MNKLEIIKYLSIRHQKIHGEIPKNIYFVNDQINSTTNIIKQHCSKTYSKIIIIENQSSDCFSYFSHKNFHILVLPTSDIYKYSYFTENLLHELMHLKNNTRIFSYIKITKMLIFIQQRIPKKLKPFFRKITNFIRFKEEFNADYKAYKINSNYLNCLKFEYSTFQPNYDKMINDPLIPNWYKFKNPSPKIRLDTLLSKLKYSK